MPLHLALPAMSPAAAAFGWLALAGAGVFAAVSLLEQVNLLFYGPSEDGRGASVLEIGLLVALLLLLFRR